jgi:hypothetical protein
LELDAILSGMPLPDLAVTDCDGRAKQFLSEANGLWVRLNFGKWRRRY